MTGRCARTRASRHTVRKEGAWEALRPFPRPFPTAASRSPHPKMGAENSILAKPPTWEQIEGGSDSPFLSQYTAGGAGETKDAEGAAGKDSQTHGRYWTSDRTAEATIRFAAKGVASEAIFPAITLSGAFKAAAERKPDVPALRKEDVPRTLERGAKPPAGLPRETWTTLTMKQYYDQTCTAAQAFINLGLGRFDGVAIYGACVLRACIRSRAATWRAFVPARALFCYGALLSFGI